MGRSVSRPSNAQVVAYAHTENSYYCRKCAHRDEPETYVNPDGTCPRCKAANRNADVVFDDDATHRNWDDDMLNLSSALRAAFPSLCEADRWLGREDHVILENSLAAVTVSEYCGLVAVCLVPERWNAYGLIEDDPLSVCWIALIEARFRRIVADTFGTELRHIATASNGEAFFERVEAS